MNICVTGANSFVGSALCKSLFDLNHQVCGIIRNRDSARGCKGINYFLVESINAETSWDSALRNIEVIIHLAARVHVLKETIPDPITAFRQINTLGTEHLARMAAQMGVRRLVFLSTIGVNGKETPDKPFNETDTLAPRDAYALSKWEAELALMQVATETSLEVVILRPPLVYGPGVKGNFLRLLQAVRRGIPLPLASIRNRRSIIFLGNLVEAIITCMTHPQAKGKTYLVSDDEHISTAELISRIARAMGKPARLWPFPAELLRIAATLAGKSAEADRLLNSLLVDSSKIRSELGWKPSSSLDQGLAETARWFLQTQATPS